MSDYSGMTTNERLFAAGLLIAFDEATKAGDEGKMADLLMKVQLSAEDARKVVITIMAHPTRFGRI